MNKLKISEKNKMYVEITTLQKVIERCQKSDEDLRNGLIKDPEYIDKKLKENELKIVQSSEKILQLKEKIEKLNNGELDDEIVREVSKNTQKVSKELEDKKKKDLVSKKEISENHILTQKVWKEVKNEDYIYKQKTYDMQKGYERFKSIDIPEYMREKLDNMPSNKGYIFRCVWFFGALPLEGNKYPLVMFEKQGEARITHEIYEDVHYVYSKNGDQRRRLVDTINRPKKLNF